MQKFITFFRKNSSKITWIFFYFFLFSLLFKYSLIYMDHDLGWHLKVGQDILQEKQVPHLNYYNYTLEGKTWVDHEWLANLFSYFIYEKIGYIALSLFFVFVISASVFILRKTAKNFFNEKNDILSIFFLFFGVWASIGSFGVRIQEITVLFSAFLVFILKTYSRKNQTKLVFCLPILFWFWASLHAGFLIGLFILSVYLFAKIFELWAKDKKYFYFFDFDNILLKTGLKKIILLVFLSSIATLLTPYGLELFSFLSDYKNTYYMTKILEWFPVHYLPIKYYQIIYISFVFTALGVWFFEVFLKKQKKYRLSFFSFILIIVFSFLSIKSRRHFPLLFISSFAFLVFVFGRNLDLKLKEKTKNLTYLCLIFIFIFFGIKNILNTNFTNTPFQNKLFCASMPCEIVDFIKQEPYKNKKIFNNYSWGGFMIWTWPEKKLFIDGRLPQYPFKNKTMIEEYELFFEKDKVEEKLKEYDIEMVLLKKFTYYKLNWFEEIFLDLSEEEINNIDWHIKNYLDENQNWEKIYEDELGLVYVKK